MQGVICGHILKIALVCSLPVTQRWPITTAHVHGNVVAAAAAAAWNKNLATPLNQVTHILQGVEECIRPVPDILIVELKPPIPTTVILFLHCRFQIHPNSVLLQARVCWLLLLMLLFFVWKSSGSSNESDQKLPWKLVVWTHIVLNQWWRLEICFHLSTPCCSLAQILDYQQDSPDWDCSILFGCMHLPADQVSYELTKNWTISVTHHLNDQFVYLLIILSLFQE